MIQSIEPRESPFRQILDPAGTLPFVKMTPSKSKLFEDDSYDVHSHGEEPALTVAIARLELPNRRYDMYFEFICRDPFVEKVKGEGLATYLLAIEMANAAGAGFRSSPDSLTEYALHIWQILERAGIAQQIGKTTKIGTDFDGTDIYMADFRVRPIITP